MVELELKVKKTNFEQYLIKILWKEGFPQRDNDKWSALPFISDMSSHMNRLYLFYSEGFLFHAEHKVNNQNLVWIKVVLLYFIFYLL